LYTQKLQVPETSICNVPESLSSFWHEQGYDIGFKTLDIGKPILKVLALYGQSISLTGYSCGKPTNLKEEI